MCEAEYRFSLRPLARWLSLSLSLPVPPRLACSLARSAVHVPRAHGTRRRIVVENVHECARISSRGRRPPPPPDCRPPTPPNNGHIIHCNFVTLLPLAVRGRESSGRRTPLRAASAPRRRALASRHGILDRKRRRAVTMSYWRVRHCNDDRWRLVPRRRRKKEKKTRIKPRQHQWFRRRIVRNPDKHRNRLVLNAMYLSIRAPGLPV